MTSALVLRCSSPFGLLKYDFLLVHLKATHGSSINDKKILTPQGRLQLAPEQQISCRICDPTERPTHSLAVLKCLFYYFYTSFYSLGTSRFNFWPQLCWIYDHFTALKNTLYTPTHQNMPDGTVCSWFW